MDTFTSDPTDAIIDAFDDFDWMDAFTSDPTDAITQALDPKDVFTFDPEDTFTFSPMDAITIDPPSNVAPSISSNFEQDPVQWQSHPSNPQLTSQYDQLPSYCRSGGRPSAGGSLSPYSCDICGRTYAQPQSVARHYREVHESSSCLYCGFRRSRSRASQYRKHLTERHPYVDPDLILGPSISTRKRRNIIPDVDPGLGPSISTRNLCMYCDVAWDHPYQYKDHLREHHPNLDPNAVLGEAPGLERRDEIIARYHKVRGPNAGAQL